MNELKQIHLLKKVEHVLSTVKSRPSANFYARMETAPWNTKRRRNPRKYLPAISFGTTLLLFVVIILLRDPLSAIAGSIASYFVTTDQPVITIQMDDLAGLQNPIHADTVESLQSLVNFQLFAPGNIPSGYQLIDLQYHPLLNSTHFLYDNQRGETLEIIQSPNIENYRRIYGLEHVEQVMIDDKIGEYSVGTWKEDESGQTDAFSETSIQAYWEPTMEHQVLRWMDDGMIFEVKYYYFYGTDVQSMKAELIEIAISMNQVK